MVALLATVSFADEPKKEEKKPGLSGTWAKESEGFSLELKFEKDSVLNTVVKAGDNEITVVAKYTVDKDGKLSLEVTDVKEKGTFPTKPEKGTKYSFKLKVDGDKAKLTDFEMPNAEGAKDVVEGEYKKK
jgi:hypothetical protein